MPQKNSNGLAIVVIVLGLTTLGALGYYVIQPSMRRVPIEESKDAVEQTPPPDFEIAVKPRAEHEKVSILSPEFSGDEMVFTRQQVDVPAGVDPHSFVVNSYLEKIPAVPKEARVISVTVKDGIAEANFNESLRAGYGTEDEQMIVNGILASLGAFPDIKAVRILIDGSPVETLGNIEIKDPQPVIRP